VNDYVSLKFDTLKMHSIEELGTNVPAFLAKLWKIVEDPETNDLICWSAVCDRKYYPNITLSLNYAVTKLAFINVF
jgi:heat shock transcription factor 1